MADLTPMYDAIFESEDGHESKVLVKLLRSLEDKSSSPKCFYESEEAKKVLFEKSFEALGMVLKSIEDEENGVDDMSDAEYCAWMKTLPRPKPKAKKMKRVSCEMMRRLRGKGVKISSEDDTSEVGEKPDQNPEEEELYGYTISNPPPKMIFPSEEAKLGSKRVRSGVVVEEDKFDPTYLEFIKDLDCKFHPSN